MTALRKRLALHLLLISASASAQTIESLEDMKPLAPLRAAGGAGSKGGGSGGKADFILRANRFHTFITQPRAVTALNARIERSGGKVLSATEIEILRSRSDFDKPGGAAIALSFVSEDENRALLLSDPERAVRVNGVDEVCSWNTKGARPEIVCVTERYDALPMALRNVQVVHEIAMDLEGTDNYRFSIFFRADGTDHFQIAYTDYRFQLPTSATLPKPDGLKCFISPAENSASLVFKNVGDVFVGRGYSDWGWINARIEINYGNQTNETVTIDAGTKWAFSFEKNTVEVVMIHKPTGYVRVIGALINIRRPGKVARAVVASNERKLAPLLRAATSPADAARIRSEFKASAAYTPIPRPIYGREVLVQSLPYCEDFYAEK